MHSVFVVLAALVVSTHASGWSDLFSFPYTSTPSIALDISCVDPTDCYVAGGDNGVGAMVYRFNGQPNGTLKTCNMTNKPMMLLTVAMEGSSGNPKGVVAGLGILSSGILYATSPTNFIPSGDPGELLGQSQNARVQGPNVLVVGVGSGSNGLAFSTNYGQTFQNIEIPITAPNGGWVRYGALVDAKTWYVTFGGWPDNQNFRSHVFHPYSAKYVVDKKTSKLLRTSKLVGRGDTAPTKAPKGGYSAVIAKTTNGGATWTTQFQDASTYYFNAIDCFDANHCAAVAEGFDQDPGVRVLTTSDGTTWNLALQIPSDASGAYSLMAVRYVSATTIWVGGGKDASISANGVFYVSKDSGKTWNVQPLLPNVADISAMDFTTGGVGYAAGVTSDDRSTLLKYTP